jgi:hypothetical protein
LEDIGTEFQKAADINDLNKDSSQFTSTATGTLTTFTAHEDGPSVVCPKTNEIYDIDDDIKDFETVSLISSLDNSCSEMSDITTNFPDFGLDYSKILEDVRTEIRKAADVNDHNIDSTQFISTATGTLTPLATYMDAPSSMFLNTKGNERLYSKELKYSWHTEGQNLPEEHIDEDDAEFVTVHRSLQEAYTPSAVLLPWTAQFS